jgi:hypothetical protein
MPWRRTFLIPLRKSVPNGPAGEAMDVEPGTGPEAVQGMEAEVATRAMQTMQAGRVEWLGGMQGNMGAGGGQMRRGNFGMLWIKVGDSLKPRRVRTGVTDGLNTEVRGKIEEGEEVVLSMTTAQGTQTSAQQQNPFAPSMQRGGTSGRGGH